MPEITGYEALSSAADEVQKVENASSSSGYSALSGAADRLQQQAMIAETRARLAPAMQGLPPTEVVRQSLKQAVAENPINRGLQALGHGVGWLASRPAALPAWAIRQALGEDSVIADIAEMPRNLIQAAPSLVTGVPEFLAGVGTDIGVGLAAETPEEKAYRMDNLRENVEGLTGLYGRAAQAVVDPERFKKRGGGSGMWRDVVKDPLGQVILPVAIAYGGVRGGIRGVRALEAKANPWHTPELLKARQSIEAIEKSGDISPEVRNLARSAASVVADPEAAASSRTFMAKALEKIAAGEQLPDSLAKRINAESAASLERVWGPEIERMNRLEEGQVGEAPRFGIDAIREGERAVESQANERAAVEAFQEKAAADLMRAPNSELLSKYWMRVSGMRERLGERYFNTLQDMYVRKLQEFADLAARQGEDGGKVIADAVNAAGDKLIEAKTPEQLHAAWMEARGLAERGLNPENTLRDVYLERNAELAKAAEKPVEPAGRPGGETVTAPSPEAASAPTPESVPVGEARMTMAEAPAQFEGVEGMRVRESLAGVADRGGEGEMIRTFTEEGGKAELVSALAEAAKADKNLLETLRKEDPAWAEEVIKAMRGEKASLGAASVNDVAFVERIANMNMARADISPAAASLLKALVERFPKEFERTEVPLPKTEAEAKSLIKSGKMTAESILKQRDDSQFVNPAKHVAARSVEIGFLEEAFDTVNKLDSLLEERKIDEVAHRSGVQKALAQAAAVSAKVRGMAAEAGRTLSAYRLMAEAERGPAKALRAMIEELERRGFDKKALEEFKKVDPKNPAAVNAWLKRFLRRRPWDMFMEAYVSGLVSGPGSHVRNLLSNASVLGVFRPLEAATAAGIEAVRAGVKGEARGRFFGEVPMQYRGIWAGLNEGSRAFLRAWREQMLDDTLMKAEDFANRQSIPGAAGYWIRTPLRLLAASDAFAKALISSSELYVEAYRRAAKEGLRGEKRANRIMELVQDTGFHLETLEQRTKAAAYNTFNQPLGEWGQKIAGLREKIPGAKLIVPFMRTPTNIAKYALERTPLNFIRLEEMWRKGDLKGAELSTELAKPVMGSILGAVVVKLALDGLVTGSGPKDKAQREALYRSGWQPYSLKIGDRYVPFGWNEPLGSVFGMAADFAELGEADGHYAQKIALSIGRNITSKIFMQGLSRALDAMSDPERYGQSWGESMAGSLVPSISAALARTGDTTLRDPDGIIDAWKSRLPGLSDSVMPKRDAWGREIARPGESLAGLGLLPAGITTAKSDPVDAEVQRVGAKVTVPGKTMQVKGKTYTMSPLEYDLYQMQSGWEAYEKVTNIVNRSIPDEKKADLIEKAISKAREEWRERFKKTEWARIAAEAK